MYPRSRNGCRYHHSHTTNRFSSPSISFFAVSFHLTLLLQYNLLLVSAFSSLATFSPPGELSFLKHSIQLSVHSINYENSHDEDMNKEQSCLQNKKVDGSLDRREWIRQSCGIGASLFVLANAGSQVAAAAVPVPLEGKNSNVIRVEEIGGGFDLLSPSSKLQSMDVYFPSSMSSNLWRVQRVVTMVEGDVGQANVVWKALGGNDQSNMEAFTKKLTEVYETKFIPAPESLTDATYNTNDGKTMRAAIMDRGFELSSRNNNINSKGFSVLSYNPETSPNDLTYSRNTNNKDDTVGWTIVQRKSELITEQGFGSDELYRISDGTGLLNNNIYRAARVKRRFRRGFDEPTGKRILDGIEIVTTYRVLDGIAGIEMPTSTCKSRLRLTAL